MKMDKSNSEWMNKFSEDIRKLEVEHKNMLNLADQYGHCNTPVKFDHICKDEIEPYKSRPHGKYAICGFIAGALFGHFFHPLWGLIFKTI